MKYKFVKLQTTGKGIFSNKTSGHQEIIDEYATKGYRYVGWFPKKIKQRS